MKAHLKDDRDTGKNGNDPADFQQQKGPAGRSAPLVQAQGRKRFIDCPLISDDDWIFHGVRTKLTPGRTFIGVGISPMIPGGPPCLRGQP
jgi:hypothetical protein